MISAAAQREVKLEIAGQSNNDLIIYLDDILSGLKYEKGSYSLVSLDDEEYQNNLDIQMEYWKKLKDEIEKVRSVGYENTDIVNMSETYFRMEDRTVSAAERYSEKIVQKNPEDYFTDPDTALDYVKRTGADSLAVAVGNAHGDYAFPPKLDFERIRVISEKTNLPLVLHGGSGLADDDFRNAVKLGVSKINIFTDIDKAGKAGVEARIAAGERTMMGLIPYEIKAMKAVVAEKIRLFGSEGRI